jgi:hypothetical protein
MLPTDLARRHDFLGCGDAPFRSWWHCGWARKPDVPVLLLEAGGTDDALEFHSIVALTQKHWW